MDIEFDRKGQLSVWDDKGKRIIGVVHATVSMNAAGVSEAALYVNVDHFKGIALKRASDGVREHAEIADEETARSLAAETEYLDRVRVAPTRSAAPCIVCAPGCCRCSDLPPSRTVGAHGP